ncbi:MULTISPECIES: molybdate ABC transporter substrate-binding protein [unclassified Meridianimarinicoccus]|uniref:molybdate ABC transporter substrate-binding protein n=1 Tax=unclassified Meridianimarinicoccus TaxID=2923344 RepID=UPI0018694585
MLGCLARSVRWCHLVGVLVFLACGAARAEEVTVFAAASLKTALDEVATGWEATTGHDLRAAYAGSSGLARQIAQGAPAEVFLSANTAWMDWLEAEGAIDPVSRRALLGNRLVLVGPTGAAPLDLSGLTRDLGEGRLAMALVDAVPAGIYGRAALENLGLWAELQSQVVEADNVRAALALVALGAAQMGIVYGTDAQAEPRVAVRAEFDPRSHPPILYPAALMPDASAAAAAFLTYLSGPEASAVFARHGFTVMP